MSILYITCGKCSHETPISIGSDSNIGRVSCDYCKEIIMNCRVVKGFVYVLSNSSMLGLLKIGITKRPIDERVKELGIATGVPTPFTVEAYFETDNPEKHEKSIHRMLDKYRIPGKEFFKIDIKEALTIVETICGGKMVNSPRKIKLDWADVTDPLEKYKLWINDRG